MGYSKDVIARLGERARKRETQKTYAFFDLEFLNIFIAIV